MTSNDDTSSTLPEDSPIPELVPKLTSLINKALKKFFDFQASNPLSSSSSSDEILRQVANTIKSVSTDLAEATKLHHQLRFELYALPNKQINEYQAAMDIAKQSYDLISDMRKKLISLRSLDTNNDSAFSNVPKAFANEDIEKGVSILRFFARDYTQRKIMNDMNAKTENQEKNYQTMRFEKGNYNFWTGPFFLIDKDREEFMKRQDRMLHVAK